MRTWLENAPACYRTPRWPDPEFPKNTQKIARFGGILGVNSGSPEFRAGVYFFAVFFVEIPGRAISGLCSRRGRSQTWGTFRIFYIPFFLFLFGVKAAAPAGGKGSPRCQEGAGALVVIENPRRGGGVFSQERGGGGGGEGADRVSAGKFPPGVGAIFFRGRKPHQEHLPKRRNHGRLLQD